MNLCLQRQPRFFFFFRWEAVGGLGARSGGGGAIAIAHLPHLFAETLSHYTVFDSSLSSPDLQHLYLFSCYAIHSKSQIKKKEEAFLEERTLGWGSE